MGTIGIVLLVCFVIVCILLVLFVAIQSDNEDGMGGLLGGRGTAAFGSQTANVLTKATAVLVVLFFALSLALALVNKKPSAAKDIGGETTEVEATETTTTEWWAESSASDAEVVKEDAE